MIAPEPQGALSYYNGRRVLVSGGASFIGSHLTELLASAGARVVVADDLSSGAAEHLSGLNDVELLTGDLRNKDFASKCAAGQDVVFHLAAAHGGRGYIETHPVESMNNMTLDHSVFHAAAAAGVAKVVFASSACVYPTSLQGNADSRGLLEEGEAGFSERGAAFADGEYGWAKLMGEMQLRAFVKQYGLDGIACRIFTAYGERENESHAVVALIAKAAARLDPYPIWGNGLQTRNFTYVSDTVMGLALAGASLTGFDTINVGSSQHHTVLELVDVICEHIGWHPKTIERQLDKPTGVASRASDNTKIRSLLAWEPSISLEEGVARTVDWYLDTPGRIDADALERALWDRTVKTVDTAVAS